MKKILLLVLSILLISGLLTSCDALIPQGLEGAGVTSFTNLELGGTLATTGNTDLTGTLQYGSGNLYPVGYATSGQQFKFGSSSITGTATAAHGLTTVTYALCTIGEDPIAGASGHSAICSVTVAANVVTVKAWKDDLITAATESGLTVYWLVIGTP